MDRRSFLRYGAVTSVSLPFVGIGGHLGNDKAKPLPAPLSSPLCVFIKPLEKYSYDDIAIILSEAGFDGGDISFRENGLIVPETAKAGLPRLVKAFEARKLSIPMVVSGITDPANSRTEDQIRLMVDAGIRYYRLGYMEYDQKLSIQDNLGQLKVRISGLEEINARHGIHGAIQNHVGTGFGAPVWDAYNIIKDCDPAYMGFQYDIRHAMAEGMRSWPLALELMLGHIRTTCIKDFTWTRENKQMKPVSVPIGDGIVDFKKYLAIMERAPQRGPVSIHYEYPLLTKEQQNEKTVEQIKHIIPLLKADLDAYRNMQI